MQYDGKTFTSAGYQISLDTLKTFLWGAATRLRGQIDAAGYKEYIFPLLFFKRISDVYDEQFEGFVHEGGVEYAEMQAEDLTIRIPEGAHWKDVRAVTENVGQRLVEAFIAIEQANPGVETDGRIVGGLDGIFGPKDGWTNKAKMPDAIITDLIEEFSKYNLSLAACPADEMGQAYEYLVGKFADDAGNTAQEFYTNRTVVTLMAEILQPKPDESITPTPTPEPSETPDPEKEDEEDPDKDKDEKEDEEKEKKPQFAGESGTTDFATLPLLDLSPEELKVCSYCRKKNLGETQTAVLRGSRFLLPGSNGRTVLTMRGNVAYNIVTKITNNIGKP